MSNTKKKWKVEITETVEKVWEYEDIEAETREEAMNIAVERSNSEPPHSSEPQDEVNVEAEEVEDED